MAIANIYVVLRKDSFSDFQTTLFRVSMLTGWVLLASLIVGFAIEVHVQTSNLTVSQVFGFSFLSHSPVDFLDRNQAGQLRGRRAVAQCQWS